MGRMWVEFQYYRMPPSHLRGMEEVGIYVFSSLNTHELGIQPYNPSIFFICSTKQSIYKIEQFLNAITKNIFMHLQNWLWSTGFLGTFGSRYRCYSSLHFCFPKWELSSGRLNNCKNPSMHTYCLSKAYRASSTILDDVLFANLGLLLE